MLKKNYTLLINSSDKYSDLWPYFFQCLKKYWPEFSANIILNTKTMNFQFDGFEIRTSRSGTDDWGRSLLKSLELVETDLILIMFDDFLLNKRVSNLKYNECLDFMRNNHTVSALYLEDITQHLGQFIFNDDTFEFIGKSIQLCLRKVPKNMSYRVNSAPAIWRVDSLRKTIHPNDSPWIWETFAAYRMNVNSQIYFCIDKNSYPIIGFHNDQGRGGAVHQGSWLQSSVDWINNEFGESFIFTRQVKSSSDKSSHNIKSKIKLLYYGFRSVGIPALWFVLQRFLVRFRI